MHVSQLKHREKNQQWNKTIANEQNSIISSAACKCNRSVIAGGFKKIIFVDGFFLGGGAQKKNSHYFTSVLKVLPICFLMLSWFLQKENSIRILSVLK